MKHENFGINVIGYINGEFGLGEAVRLLIKAIKNQNIPVALINYDVATFHRHTDTTFTDFTLNAPYSVNLILLGPTEGVRVLNRYKDTNIFKSKYNIFYLNWESEHFPLEYINNLSVYDEIWVPAQYCKDSLKRHFRKTINVIPYPIEIALQDNIDEIATSFFNKNSFNFLFIFDYNSTLERKNTLNLIEAFQLAFESNDSSVSLTIKTSRSTRFKNEKKSIFDKISNHKNIFIVEEIFEKNTLHNIINSCDCYVSLHRSEGFGLTMAEAMYFSKPVIATGYSGNLEFMDHENSFLVDYEMTKIDSDITNYEKNTIWSNPNVKHASELMKLVRTNSEQVKTIALNGNKTIVSKMSNETIGGLIKNKLEKINEDYVVDLSKDYLILLSIENLELREKLRKIEKSKLIKVILNIKTFFRKNKIKRREKKQNKQ